MILKDTINMKIAAHPTWANFEEADRRISQLLSHLDLVDHG